MKTNLTRLMVPVLLSASGAMAAEGDAGFTYSGTVGVGVVGSRESSGTVDAAKYNEYRDLSNGGFIEFDIKGRGPAYYLDAIGENLGRDDQSFTLKGGEYTKFKYQVYETKTVHNWAFGAKTPYVGVGSDTLLGGFPNTNTDNWHVYDLRQKREDVGGMFEMSNNSPWYVRLDANEVRDEGLKLIAGSNGTSPGQGFNDKPFPIDTKTQNVSAEGGYATKQGQLSVSMTHSKFMNAYDDLKWTNYYFGSALDTTTLAADNSQTRFAVNGVLKQLPLDSALSARVTQSKTKNDRAIATTALNTGGVFGATNPSTDTFNGEVIHKTASVSWHLNPTKELDSRIYWNKFEKENNSTQVAFTNLPSGLQCGRIVDNVTVPPTVLDTGDCHTELLGYKKTNVGIDVGYRINPRNRVVLGYDQTDLERERIDFDETKDKRTSIEYRNTSLDSLGVRAKVQRLERRSHFLEGDAGSDNQYPVPPGTPLPSNNPEYLNRYIARFDAADLDQNLVKLMFDARPVEMIDVGLELIIKKNNYKDTVLGRTSDDRQEIYLSVGYGAMDSLRVMAFADMEKVTRDSTHRAIGTVSNGGGTGINTYPSGYCQTTAQGCYDPYTAPTNSNYNWEATTDDKNWSIGLGADWVLSPRTKLSVSGIVERTDGHEDIVVQAGATPSTLAVPIELFDDTKKRALYLKATHKVSKTLEIAGTYSYERYHFKDISYDGYQYIIGTGTTASYLSGAYANPEYLVQTLYLVGKYSF